MINPNMMKRIGLSCLVFCFSLFAFGQQDDRITTMDFVEILNGQREEAVFYFKNNWMELRKKAHEKKQVHSYQMMEAPYSEEAPFHLILITTYGSEEQYNAREENFQLLIEESGGLRLLNEKQPNTFRKNVFYKEDIKHLNQDQY